jgi:hypothetical protein
MHTFKKKPVEIEKCHAVETIVWFFGNVVFLSLQRETRKQINMEKGNKRQR